MNNVVAVGCIAPVDLCRPSIDGGLVMGLVQGVLLGFFNPENRTRSFLINENENIINVKQYGLQW